jgi:glycosyltransferase EpsF
MRNNRVLHIVSSLGMGGAETWLIKLVEFINSNEKNVDIRIDFLVTNGKKDVFDDLAIKNGAQIHYLTLNGKTTLSFIKGFREILKENNYLAVHDHQDIISGWHFLFGLGRLPKVRVSHFHNPYYQLYANYGTSFSRKLKIKIGYALIRLTATHIVGTSSKLLAEHGISNSRYKKQEIGPLHCSFDIIGGNLNKENCKKSIREEFNIPPGKKIILFVGRFDSRLILTHPRHHKNSLFAAEIFQYLNSDYVLLMVGANHYIKEGFVKFLEEKNIQEQIHLLGIRHDVESLMCGSDLLLFPSRAEGLGMVAVEAQATGLQVLVSDSVPQECMVIEELVNFYKLDDGPEKWAEKITQITNRPVPQISKQDLRWEESNFNIKVSIKELEKVYMNK